MSERTETDPPALPLQSFGQLLKEMVSGSNGAVLLVILVLICYAVSSQFLYIWDDDAYVVNNPLLRSFRSVGIKSAFDGLSKIWTEPVATPQYYPMTFTSFWLEAQTFGLSAKLSHIINIFLHALSTLMLWRILRKLSVPGAWVAAAIFAVHPIQVESVVWISERKNTLSLLFGLVSVWLYLRYSKIGVDESSTVAAPVVGKFRFALPEDSARLYGLFLMTFVLGLLSKTTVAVIPAVLAVILWWKRGRLTWKDIQTLIPPLVLGMIGGSVTSYIEHSPRYVGASGMPWDVSLVNRIALAGQTTCWYAWKMIWPYPLIFNYPKWNLDASQMLQWLPLAAVIAVIAVLWILRRKLGRAPLAGMLIYCICLLPASGLFMVYPMRYSWVADHFVYIASAPFIALLVAGLSSLLTNFQYVSASITALVIAGFCTATVIHSYAFKDIEALWKDTLQQNNKSWLAAVSYGVWLNQRASEEQQRFTSLGDESQAVEQRDLHRKYAQQWSEIALKRNPKSFEAYCNLGLIHFAKGEYDDALRDFITSKDLAAEQGARGYLQPMFAMANLYELMGRKTDAEAMYKELERLEPEFAARRPRPFAVMHVQIGDGFMKKITEPIKPTMSDANHDLLQKAYEQFVRATELAPDFIPPKLALARILLDSDDTKEALQQVNDILALDKNNVDAQFIIVSVALKVGSYDAAVPQLVNILQIAPGYLPAHMQLAQVYYALGRKADAVSELETTLKHVPNFTPAVKLLESYRAGTTQPAVQQLPMSQQFPTTQQLFAPVEQPVGQ